MTKENTIYSEGDKRPEGADSDGEEKKDEEKPVDEPESGSPPGTQQNQVNTRRIRDYFDGLGAVFWLKM